MMADQSNSHKFMSFLSLKPKTENRIHVLFGDLLDRYTKLVFKYPFLFLLVGIIITSLQLCGLSHFNVRLETDVENLISPINSKIKTERDRLNYLFGNVSEDYFNPHQVIIPGYSFVVLIHVSGNRSLLEVSTLKDIENFHTTIMKNVSVKSSDRSMSYEDVCATYNKFCVVKGDIIFKLLNESLQQGSNELVDQNVTCPIYEGIDLTEILGNVVCKNGTLFSASILKLIYFISEQILPSSLAYSWIDRFVKKIQRMDIPSGLIVSPTHTHLTSSDIDVDVTGFDLYIYAITYGMLLLGFVFRYRLCFLVILGSVSLGSLGVISYFGIHYVKLMIFVAAMIFDWAVYSIPYMVKDCDTKELKEYCKYNSTKLVYILFFIVGLFSPYLIIRIVCSVICISMSVCVLFGATIIPSYVVIRQKYIMKICDKYCSKLNCVLCVIGCTTRDCSNKEGEEEEQNNQQNENDGMFCRILSRIKIAVLIILYVAYIAVSTYGCTVETEVPTLCYRSAAFDDTFSKFCILNSNYFNTDIIVTIAIETKTLETPNISTFQELTEVYDKTNTLVTDLKSSSVIGNVFEINWMTSFFNQRNATGNFIKHLETFINNNPKFTNDIVVDFNAAIIKCFRVYLKTSNLINIGNVNRLQATIQELINNSTVMPKMKVIFYAPEFILYQNSSLTNVYFTVSVAILCILLSIAKYHYHLKFLLILFAFASVIFGVVGFSRIWNVDITYMSTLPGLFIFSSIAELALSNFPLSLYLWFAISLSIVILISIFTFPLYTLRSIYIPLFLYSIFTFIHFVIFANIFTEEKKDTSMLSINTATTSDGSIQRNSQIAENGELSLNNQHLCDDYSVL